MDRTAGIFCIIYDRITGSTKNVIIYFFWFTGFCSWCFKLNVKMIYINTANLIYHKCFLASCSVFVSNLCFMVTYSVIG